jgi:alpha-mannosidase
VTSLRAIILSLVISCGVTALLVVPSRAFADPKRIYLANDDHTDYMWAADRTQYRTAFISMLDYYMSQAEATAGLPADSRGRFNCDGSLWVWEYEHNTTPAEFQRLVGHLRSGDISMPLNTAVLCYGGMPAEAVLRSMYYAGRLERREGLRFPLAVAMENQTLPGGLASLWAGAGALYSWRGVCGCATKTVWDNRPRDIYHYTGPDGASVCMKWNSHRSSTVNVGSYGEANPPTRAVDYLDHDPGFAAAWPWDVTAAFGFGRDEISTTTDSIVNASQRLSNSNRRVIVSNEADFFQDFLSHYGAQIPHFSGSFGNEWELYQASMGAVTAKFKREVEKLRTAEAVASVASLVAPGFMDGRDVARDRAFLATGLFYEHNWTADGPISKAARAQFERDMLADLAAYVDPLQSDALAAVAARVARTGADERHLVFNPLSWTRTDVADLSTAVTPPLRVIDVATGVEVPSQVMPGSPVKVRILAADVPSVGYRVYAVRPGAGASFPPSATIASPSFDNGIYAVRLGARGNIVSLIDHKDGNRELVDATAGGSIHDLGSGNGAVTVESSGPVSTTLLVVAGGSPAHETRVTLVAGLDRVDVEGHVTQNFSGLVKYTSSFALPGAIMRHEEVGMIARVARAANGGDYADQNARTDWLTMNHFVDLSQAGRGITMSNGDSPFFQAGNSTPQFLDTATPSIGAVVGMQVDGTSLGITNQGGDTDFTNRFAFRTHAAYDPAAAMRMALEHQNPLVAARLTGDATGPLPETSWSLLALPSPDVLLWSIKPAEEGIASGLIARVWNLAEGPSTASLSLPGLGLTEARRTTHIETDLSGVSLVAGAVPMTLERQQLATFRLFPASSPGALASIASPTSGAFFAVGDAIALAPSTDRSAAGFQYRWEADLHAGGQDYPNRVVIDQPSGTLVVEPLANISDARYAIRLIVRDPSGVLDTASVDLRPEIDLAPSTIVTVPPDTLDEQTAGSFGFRLVNRGRMPSPPCRWDVRVDGAVVASGNDAVAASDSVTLSGTIPPLAGGPHVIRVVADSLGQLAETVETNNAVTRTVIVRGQAPNQAPVAVASATPSSGTAPFTVAFSSAGSSDPDGDPLAFSWAFGDGAVSTLSNPSHGYDVAGTYVALLTVSDGRGGQDTATVVITARPPGATGFPSAPVVDDFNRADGGLGATWLNSSGLAIASGELRLTTTGSVSPVWNGAVFGPEQEAYLTLTAITATSPEHDLMLKVQGTTWSTGHIEVRYDNARRVVMVSTYTPSTGWKTIATSSTMTFVAGDRLGARAHANGNVEVWKNSTQIFAASVSGWPYAANGGRIGLSFDASSQSRADNFGGGNAGPDVTPPAFLAGPTALAGLNSATIQCTLSEPARAVVSYGRGSISDSIVAAPSASHSITIPSLARGTAYVWRIAVTDPSGNTTLSNLASFTTIANHPPVATASAVPTSGPAPLSVTFSSAGSSDPDGDPITLAWAFGDGQTATGPSATHVYTFGSFTATLTVTDSAGASATRTMAITSSNGRPAASIGSPLDRSFFTLPDSIRLAGAATDAQDPPSSLALRWEVDAHDLGGGVRALALVFTGSTAAFQAGDVALPGTWLAIRLIATDLGGLSDTAAVAVYPEVDLAPSDVVVAPDPPQQGLPASFTFVLANHGREPAFPSRWILRAGGVALAQGDTAVAARDSITVTRTVTLALGPGSYTLRVVTDSLGQVVEPREDDNTRTRALTVLPGPDLTLPTFASGPTVTPALTAATVSWTASEPVTGTVRYGTSPALPDSVVTPLGTSHAAAIPGLARGTAYSYQVAMRDTAGNVTRSAVLGFSTLANRPPVAAASATPASGLAPLTVTFSTAGSSDPDGDPIAFAWAFGDNQSGSGPSPTHVYAAGTYTAVVTASDAFGGSATRNVTISALAPSVFPVTAVLDNFNRSNGTIGSSWVGSTSGLRINSNVLVLNSSGSFSPVWNSPVFGPNQEAYVTLVAITSSSPEHDLMLKVQGTTWNSGHIEVRYDATVRRILVSTYAPNQGWRQYGSGFNVTMVAGDVLGARAYATGNVEVYRNGTKLGAVPVTGWPFLASGGRVGLALTKALSSRLDNFGGGSITVAAPQSAVALSTEEPQGAVRPATDAIAVPNRFEVAPVTPNPSGGAVTLAFDLPRQAPVSLAVYDLSGRRIWSASRAYEAGRWRLEWNGRLTGGERAPSGVYLARVSAGGEVRVRRFVLL